MAAKMTRDTSSSTNVALRGRVDDVLKEFFAERRAQLIDLDPDAGGGVDEISRLVAAGGKRLRPILCYWGYRAGGAEDGEAIIRAASALELLHTMALIHDDLIDAAAERRGVETVHVRLAHVAGSAAGGRAGALLVGDLAAVLADQLLLESGFPPEAITRALAPYHRMRVSMAAGQWLELVGEPPREPSAIRRRASLRGGAYTAEGPLAVGAALADTSDEVVASLARFARPFGQAFQIRDDLEDGEATALGVDEIERLVDQGIDSLAFLPPDVRDALVNTARAAVMP